MHYLTRYWWILLMLLLAALLIFGFRLLTGQSGSGYTFKTSSQTVIKELRELNRLETASFTIEKVIDAGTDGNSLQELLFGDRILLIAHGQVVAGFDLSKLESDAITVDGDTLRVTLPPPQILTASLDSEETKVYDRRQGVLSKGDKDLESAARAEAEAIITSAACSGGILNEATKNGRSQLTALFKTLGFQTVVITIPQGSC